MKQLYCPHRVSISGIQQYCQNGKSPMDCEHCDCPDKQMLDVTVTMGSVILPKNKTNSLYVMCYGLDGRQVSQENSSKREVLDTSETLSDEMKSDAEVADDLGITPEQYRDMVTDMLFEPKEINPSEFDKRLNSLLKEFESLPKEDLIDNLEFYLNVVKEKRRKEAEERYKQGYHDAFSKAREWLEENLMDIWNNKYFSIESIITHFEVEVEPKNNKEE